MDNATLISIALAASGVVFANRWVVRVAERHGASMSRARLAVLFGLAMASAAGLITGFALISAVTPAWAPGLEAVVPAILLSYAAILAAKLLPRSPHTAKADDHRSG